MVKVKKIIKKKAETKANESKIESTAPKEGENVEKNGEDPKEVPKKEKKKKTFTSSASPEEQAKLTKEAIKEIQRGISNPETRKPNTAFIPEGWHLRYREALGPYKQFVAAQSEHFKIHELNTGGWLVASQCWGGAT